MTEQTPQPQTLRQRIEAIIQARHRDSETFMALQEALDETAEQPIKVYGVTHYEDWHEYPEWSKPDPDLLYARREDAQEFVDKATESARRRYISDQIAASKRRHAEWRQSEALLAAGLTSFTTNWGSTVPLTHKPEPTVLTEADLADFVPSREQIGCDVVELEVQP
jgi:hypothetical protein